MSKILSIVMLTALGIVFGGCTRANSFCEIYTPVPTIPLEIDGSLEVDMNNAIHHELC